MERKRTRPAEDRPIPGRQYRLTGTSDVPSILRGDSWEASEVREFPIAREVEKKRGQSEKK